MGVVVAVDAGLGRRTGGKVNSGGVYLGVRRADELVVVHVGPQGNDSLLELFLIFPSFLSLLLRSR